jgi:TrmH family RNA methyltransferase
LRLRKHRSAEGRLLAEGPQAVREALAEGLVEALLATPEGASRAPSLVETGWWAVDEKVMAELADTVTPSGLLAICRWEPCPPETPPEGRGCLVICAQIRDPGNLGTVIRCADAFGAAAVVTTKGSVDVANPKTVRASAGSLFHLPIVADADLAATVTALRRQGVTVLAADGHGDADLNDLAADGTLAGRVAWLLGNEAWGLPEADRALADRLVRIPMWGRAESLNLATAAAVVLYATASAAQPNYTDPGSTT